MMQGFQFVIFATSLEKMLQNKNEKPYKLKSINLAVIVNVSVTM